MGGGGNEDDEDEDDGDVEVSGVGSFSFGALHSSGEFLLQPVSEEHNKTRINYKSEQQQS